MNIKICIFLIFSFVFCQRIDAGSFYHRHIIILVDQTKTPHEQVPDGFLEIGKAISLLLQNDSLANKKVSLDETESSWPVNFEFNPKTDELSIFGFGIDSQEDGGTFWNIRDSIKYNQIASNEVFDYISKALIHPYASFQSSGKTIPEFINTHLKRAFSDSFVLKTKGINLARYVYPCALKFINTDPSASEYYIIIVSNFETGLTAHGSQHDDKNLIDITVNETYLHSFTDELKKYKSLFYTTDFLTLQKTRPNLYRDELTHAIIAVGYKLGIRSLQGTSVYITSNLKVEQKSTGSRSFILYPVSIAFTHDESLKVTSISLEIENEEGEIICNQDIIDEETLNSLFVPEEKKYELPKQQLNFNTDLSAGDKLKFNYIFYATAKDNGKDVMPFVYPIDREYILTSDDFKTPLDKMTIITLCMLLLLGACCAFVARKIYIKRGREKEISVDFTIYPISNTRFMDVKQEQTGIEVLSYDCWYWQKGDTQRNIYIRGNVDIESKSFAKQYIAKVKYVVNDIDLNYDFSFRPEGNDRDGSLRKKDKEYEVPLSSDGSFEFNVIAYKESNIETPNFEIENILNVKVTVFVGLYDKYNKKVSTSAIPPISHTYKFICKPQIENSDLWVAFDPGTSGSCVAYGYGGRQDSLDNIGIAYNQEEDTAGNKTYTPIFPSMISINKESKLFDGATVESLEEIVDDRSNSGDFYFGNLAKIYYGTNGFQSIKKLLGYTTKFQIKNGNTTKEIAGKDLAYLVIKGLLNHFEKYVKTHEQKDGGDSIVNPNLKIDKKMFLGTDGTFTPHRAIVAVPNNYTLVKIKDMVDSIKRTKKFKEVHYIYESEGVMMAYFRQNWSKLPSLRDKTFVVFDMGGATINTTAFRINIHSDNGNIRNIEVSTIAKIGFCIGGDDIDFAIIQIMCGIPSFKKKFPNEDAIEKYRNKYKKDIIEKARQIKLDWIDRVNDSMRPSNITKDLKLFWGELHTWFEKHGQIELPIEPQDEDINFLAVQQAKNHCIVKRYVLNNVRDAIDELLSSIKGSSIELIFSGRSTLYPGIQETVISEIVSDKFKCTCNVWDGFNNHKTGKLNDQKVKTAVVLGACWYAMFSKYITMRHDIVTSTFGYVDMVHNKSKFIPVIKRNTPFDEEQGRYVAAPVKPEDSTLANVEFIQMMGSDYDKIYEQDIRHKMSRLVTVPPQEIRQMIKTISIEVDKLNNFTYTINMAGNDIIRKTIEASDVDILDENSEAYAFAAITSIDEVSVDSNVPKSKSKIRM